MARVYENPDAGQVVLRGWAQIAKALGCSSAAAYRASRRSVDPLRVRYDPFDRPWIYRSRIEAWVADNDRSARQYDVERESEKRARENAV